MAATTAALGWSSKDSALTDAVHQMAIDKVLRGTVSADDLNILENEAVVVDNDQQTAASHEHSMTGVETGETEAGEKPVFIHKTEAFVLEKLSEAIRLRKAGSESAAFTALGQAIHPLQDATSPSHAGFQLWNDNLSWWNKAIHLAKERVYPDASQGDYEARLEGAVQWAYDMFTEKAPLPAQFFDANGILLLPPAYLTRRQ